MNKINKLKRINKIEKAFENKKAFIAFITGGDPDINTTENLIYALEEGGADIIEIGIPFSIISAPPSSSA